MPSNSSKPPDRTLPPDQQEWMLARGEREFLTANLEPARDRQYATLRVVNQLGLNPWTTTRWLGLRANEVRAVAVRLAELADRLDAEVIAKYKPKNRRW